MTALVMVKNFEMLLWSVFHSADLLGAGAFKLRVSDCEVSLEPSAVTSTKGNVIGRIKLHFNQIYWIENKLFIFPCLAHRF